MLTSLTLHQARMIADATLAAPRSRPDSTVAVAIVDGGGHPILVIREDGAPPLLAHIAQAKAHTCMAYGHPTKAMMDWAAETPTWFHGAARVSQERMGLPLIGDKGGVCVQDADGRTIGAVGVSGETADTDEIMAVAGIEAAGLTAFAG